MTGFDHWQPVLLSRRLRTRPVAVKVQGQRLVLFRGERGKVGAIPEACPHRGMSLLMGRVRKGRLVCPYHGWQFETDGNGRSPGNPKLRVQAECWAVEDRHGAIWIKRVGSDTTLPTFDFDGYETLHQCRYLVRAPVEVVLDNFTEVEHTGVAHWQFGYDPDQLHKVTNETTAQEKSIRVRTSGPQKDIFWISRVFLGIQPQDHLVCQWETFFDPLHSVWEWWWEDPQSGTAREYRSKAIAYFIPVSEESSILSTFYFMTHRSNRGLSLSRLARPLLKRAIEYELGRDRWLVENVVDRNVLLRDRTLGRFDRALFLQRERLAKASNAASSPAPREDSRSKEHSLGSADPLATERLVR